MLILADQFLAIFRHARVLWIGGLFGKHKTSFAYALAETYLKQGYRLVTNNLSVWADRKDDVDFDDDGKLHVVVVLDEAGLDVKFRVQAERMTAFLRKMDVYIIMPSFWPPAQMLRFFVLQPTINWRMIGLPMVQYRWSVRLKMWDAAGWFLWAFPERVYGTYSSLDPGEDAQVILDWLADKAAEYEKRFEGGRRPRQDDLPEMGEDASWLEAAEQIGDAADSISFSLGKAQKRRRR